MLGGKARAISELVADYEIGARVPRTGAWHELSHEEQREIIDEHRLALCIGDVVGNPMLAHKATYEAVIAAEVICGMRPTTDGVIEIGGEIKYSRGNGEYAASVPSNNDGARRLFIYPKQK